MLCRVVKQSTKVVGTSTSSSDGGNPSSVGPGLNAAGQNVPIVPHIGGRNRSLPNLSKQNSGPNSARSNKGDEK
jgi:hypothetical protein